MNKRRPIALVILDGWGISENETGNAVKQSSTPNLDQLFKSYPSTQIGASGMDVGLPDGQMGNSEVGHLNIGAGRIVYQDLTRIGKSIKDGSFSKTPALAQAMEKTKEAGGKLHIMGLLSDGGVHSHNTHLYALIQAAKTQGISEVLIHPFLDGRDTPPKSGVSYLQELEGKLTEMGAGRIATISGRYYAMDRDNRWERVEKAWRAMVLGDAKAEETSSAAIQKSYEADKTDEFFEPTVIGKDVERNRIEDGDSIIFFNFRSDRAREITRAFTAADFEGFDRPTIPSLASYVCMTEYDETFKLPAAFPPETHSDLLGEIVSKAGLTQLRIAETEKYAHVTFFFNGGSESCFPGEERILVPSPRDISTYDQKPAMSAQEVTDRLISRVQAAKDDLIILNFANPDMVGHTGILSAAVEAMETVDTCVGQLTSAILEAGGSLLLTADHGNCEQMGDGTGQPHTAHTSNPVPLILVDPEAKDKTLTPGILADIAPTLLELLGIEKPEAMTGKSLIN